MKEHMKNWFKDNKIVVIFIAFSLLMELISVYAVEGVMVIRDPKLYVGVWGMLVFILLMLKNNRTRFIVSSLILLVQAIGDLVFVVVYDMTGQYFDFGMLYLRNDAWGILESIPMNFIAFYSALFFCIMYFIFGNRCAKRIKKIEVSRISRIVYGVMAVVCGCVAIYTTYLYNADTEDKYNKMINNKEGSVYSSMGIMGNLVNEISKGLVYDETEKLDDKEIEKYIYGEVSEKSPYFTVSKDNNVVTILVESFEWFSFIQNDEYPNGLGLNQDELEYLFPNLTKFYNESVVMTNFHSKEKTDISETLSILGSYPTDAYVDYDFQYNEMPQTVPNILKYLTNGDITMNSFHNGYKSFYNRELTHAAFGFESLSDCYDMIDMTNKAVEDGTIKEPTMFNYMDDGERNLDSEMITTCKDKMFPTNSRFYTYITSITMHGIYYERENLSDNMEKLLEVYIPKNPDDENEQILMNYVTTVMDFDKALGIMMDDLEEKGLLDNTTIVMFGDHNSYYQQLSNYVKDIYDYDTDNYYTDLYKVPLMIYDKNVEHQVIDKFTCTSDMVPTILDLLGIRVYSNMYYGHSVFSDEESVLYSRAYGFFVGDGILCRNFNNMLYYAPSVTDKYFKEFKTNSVELVNKIKYCDQIFYNDYFADDTHMETYRDKLSEIN